LDNNFSIEYILSRNVLFVKNKIPKDLLEYFEPAECGKCYMCRLVDVFREVKRVLKDDSTLWLNLGDSYNGSGKAGSNPEYQSKHTEFGKPSKHKERFGMPTNIEGLKPKDLIGIPWRVAFALQADGWYLRSDIIWHKPNPMPESVKDRPTKSHEYIFLLAKSKKYYYDYQAVLEPAAYDGRKDTRFKGATKSYDGVMPNGQPQSFAQNGHERLPNKIRGFKTKDNGDNPQHHGNDIVTEVRGRNKRTVWTVNTKPFKGAHFAVFPPKLITPCILAGSREGGVVLDPFCGSGTTGVVCAELVRDFIGIELNPEYVKMAEDRIYKASQQMRLL